MTESQYLASLKAHIALLGLYLVFKIFEITVSRVNITNTLII